MRCESKIYYTVWYGSRPGGCGRVACRGASASAINCVNVTGRDDSSVRVDFTYVRHIILLIVEY